VHQLTQCSIESFNMTTKFKVGDKVKVLTQTGHIPTIFNEIDTPKTIVNLRDNGSSGIADVVCQIEGLQQAVIVDNLQLVTEDKPMSEWVSTKEVKTINKVVDGTGPQGSYLSITSGNCKSYNTVGIVFGAMFEDRSCYELSKSGLTRLIEILTEVKDAM
jgi:hypothetical protein